MTKVTRTITIDSDILEKYHLVYGKGELSPTINEWLKVYLQYEKQNGQTDIHKELDQLQKEETILLNKKNKLIQLQKQKEHDKQNKKAEIQQQLIKQERQNYGAIDNYFFSISEKWTPEQRNTFNDEWQSYLTNKGLMEGDLNRIQYWWRTYGQDHKQKIFKGDIQQ